MFLHILLELFMCSKSHMLLWLSEFWFFFFLDNAEFLNIFYW